MYYSMFFHENQRDIEKTHVGGMSKKVRISFSGFGLRKDRLYETMVTNLGFSCGGG